MDIARDKKVNFFINRLSNFRCDNDAFRRLIIGRSEFFARAYDLKESLKSSVEDAKELNNEQRDELLENIFVQLCELAMSPSDTYEVFDLFVEYVPEYFENHGKNVEDLLETIGKDPSNATDYLNLQVRESIFQACFFRALCVFMEQTRRFDAFSQSEYAYTIHENDSLDIEWASYSELTKSRNRRRELKISDTTLAEADRLKQWRARTLSKNRGYVRRSKWDSILLTTIPELSMIHPIVFKEDKFKYHSFGRLNTLYSKLHEAIKSPMDDGHNERVHAACNAALAKIKTIKYKNYVEQCKHFLRQIDKNKQFYGITLCRFEMAHSLYSITDQIRIILNATSEDDINDILITSVILKDMYFPKVYEAFKLIEDFEDMHYCVHLFNTLFADVFISGIMILDELIDESYFGEGDSWAAIFFDMINKLSKNVLYSPDDIDYATDFKAKKSKEYNKPLKHQRVQGCFESILSASVLMHYEMDAITDYPDNEYI